MKASHLTRLLTACFPKQLGVAVEGDPGGGKTAVISAAAAACKMELIIEHPSIADPTDYKGLPVMQKDGSAKFAPIGLIARLLKVTKPTVVFADDFGQAQHATQAAFMQLVHGGRLNDVQLPTDKITWVLATNGTGDRAAVNALLEPVKSRFHTLVRLDVDVTDWVQWAFASGEIAPEVIAFIRFRPELLNKFAPSREFKNCPSPRTVQHVQRFEPGDTVSIDAKGGGGTDFRPVFEHIDGDKNEDEPPVCVVYLTDLDGSFPNVEPDYPVLWCVPEGSCCGSRPPPFGEIVAVK